MNKRTKKCDFQFDNAQKLKPHWIHSIPIKIIGSREIESIQLPFNAFSIEMQNEWSEWVVVDIFAI